MAEPTTSSAAGFAAYKLGIAYGLPSIFISVMVMVMTKPRSNGEWTVALLSTMIGSVCGGAFAVMHFSLRSWVDSYEGLVALFGLVVLCGTPWWVLVRAFFRYFENRREHDIGQLASDIGDTVSDVKSKIKL